MRGEFDTGRHLATGRSGWLQPEAKYLNHPSDLDAHCAASTQLRRLAGVLEKYPVLRRGHCEIRGMVLSWVFLLFLACPLSISSSADEQQGRAALNHTA
jgi:hypothetical protein